MTTDTINDARTIAGNGEGTLLANRYRIVKQLGQGGMGSVWLAEDTQLDNKLFAIKMLPAILVSNKRAYRQLKDEALVAMQLVHPNIVQIRAFEENDGNPFLVMDYIDGQTLDDYLADHALPLEEAASRRFESVQVGEAASRRFNSAQVGEAASRRFTGTTGVSPVARGLPESDVLRILRPIAAALDYAHAKGVVHRDVKPGNVMIAKDGTPYILDFGIAREIQETMTRVTGKLSSGTLLYMSPEQLMGESPKPAQDVYSFAAMAYECLKGEPPFVRGAIEDQIKNKQPDPLPTAVLTGKAAILAAGVMAGLAKKPEDRPPTCTAVLRGSAASAASVQTANGSGKSAASPNPQQPGWSRCRVTAAILVVALLSIIGGVWLLTGRSQDREASAISRRDSLLVQKSEPARPAAVEVDGMESRSVQEIPEPQRPRLEWKATLRDARSRSKRSAGTNGGFEYGDALTEHRVMGALRWLKAQQGSDGSWGNNLAPQLTALAVLVYLGHGETPMGNKNSADEFSATVENGLSFLVDYVQRYEGSRQRGNFIEDISYLYAVQALCEAYGMTANEKYGMVAVKGLHHIVTKLRPDGRYVSATEGIAPCLILTTYSIQTLSVGLMVGLQPTGAKDCIAKSLRFVREMDYQILPESVRGDLVMLVKSTFAFIGVRTSDGIERVAENYDDISPALGPLINRSSCLTSALFSSAMRKGASSVTKNKWKAWNTEMKKRYISECITTSVQGANGRERSVCYWDHYFDGHSKVREHVIMATCIVTCQLMIYYRTPIDFSISGIVGEDI